MSSPPAPRQRRGAAAEKAAKGYAMDLDTLTWILAGLLVTRVARGVRDRRKGAPRSKGEGA